MSSIDWDKPYTTRDGREVLIYTMSSRIGTYPIRGEVKSHAGDWNESSWTSVGMWSHERHAPEDDLVNVPQKHTVWVNVYRESVNEDHCHNSKDEADANSTGDRVACFLHTFTEGEGLE